MIKNDSWKYLLFLLSFNIFISCSSIDKFSKGGWNQISDPCEEGNVTSIEGEINLIKQRQRKDCWFACYGMLKSWKDQKKYSYEDIKKFIGNWNDLIKRNLGLFVSEQPKFIKEMDLGYYPPASYPLEAYIEMLQKHGPLIICMGKSNINHARILYEIQCGNNYSSTFFYLINPKNRKVEKWNAYKFFNTFESEAEETISEHYNLNEEEQKNNQKMLGEWRYQILFIN